MTVSSDQYDKSKRFRSRMLLHFDTDDTMAPSRGIKRTADGVVVKQSSEGRLVHREEKRRTQGTVVNFDEHESDDPSGRLYTSTNNAVSILKQRSVQLSSVRRQLPMWNHQEEIKVKLRNHDTLLLVGETGSGKSTQVPQYLFNEPWCKRKRLVDGTSVGVLYRSHRTSTGLQQLH